MKEFEFHLHFLACILTSCVLIMIVNKNSKYFCTKYILTIDMKLLSHIIKKALLSNNEKSILIKSKFFFQRLSQSIYFIPTKKMSINNNFVKQAHP